MLALMSVLAGVLGATTGAFLGLWWGERGRRIALEGWASHHGVVSRPPARVDQPAVDPQQKGEHIVGGREPPAFDLATDQAVLDGLMRDYDIDEEEAMQVRGEVMDALHTATGVPS